jgi:hypothetical protein
MTHYDHFVSGARAKALLQFTDVVDALSDFFDILVKTTYSPTTVGGGKEEVKEGPFRGLYSLCNLLDVRHGVEPVCEAANEENTMGFGSCVWLAKLEGC